MTDLKKAFELIEEGFTLLGLTLEASTSSEAPAAKEKPSNGRRRRKKAEKKSKAPASGPNIEDARATLLEVVNAFEDGNDAVEEILGEVEDGVKKISEIDPKNYQEVIDAAKKYLADSEEDDD